MWPEFKFGDRTKLKFNEVKMQKDCCGGQEECGNLQQNYFQNQEKCNQMINELKGIVSQARGDYQANIAKMVEIDRKVDAIFNYLVSKNE